MKNKNLLQKVLIFILLILIMVLFSCSVVFKASLNGTFEDYDDGNGINDATVLIYTDENNFNDDWATIQNDNTAINSLTNYYNITTTATEGNQDGHFNFNGIVWKTLFPQFGKDADRVKIFLILWHEDYEPVSYETYITSDVTNSLPPIKGTKAKDQATIRGTVIDANSNEGVANVNVKVYIPTSWSYDSNNNIDTSTLKFNKTADYNLVTDDNGQFRQKISFIKNPNEKGINKIIIRLTFDRNNYKIDASVDDSGDDNLKDDYDMDGDGTNDVYYQTGEISPDTTYVLNNVPIKKTHFTETVEGLAGTAGNGINGYTVKIWVNVSSGQPSSYYDTNEPDYVTKTQTQAIGDGSTTRDGYFSFDNISWDDDTYTGKQSHIVCHIRTFDLSDAKIKDIDIDVYSDATNYFDLTN